MKTLVTLSLFAATLAVAMPVESARAEQFYTKSNIAAGAAVKESSLTVGTRRVGMVGYHPYPLVVSHTDSSTVRTNAQGDVTTNNSVITSQTYQPYAYTTGGGSYYTSTGTKYYGNEGLDIKVRNTGSFND
ncbi:MAG: hypothetical protein KGQ41_08280 [Alphaproteobacteria bacterium]|nr:hypothetical protein [Alphaproteobacteria bacterium]